jgi:hypothetical protein
MRETRFRINRFLRVQGRGLFACGEIVEGVVAIGMNVHWPLQGDALTTSTPVVRVEYLDLDRAAGRVEVALGISVDDEVELLLRSLLEPGMVVEVSRAETGAP